MDKDIETMVAEIEARAAKATPGPWLDTRYHDDEFGPHIEDDTERKIAIVQLDCPEHDDNARFIERARVDVPKLCAMWREAIAERDALRERLAKLESATRSALHWLGPEYFDDGKPLENLGRLVNIKS